MTTSSQDWLSLSRKLDWTFSYVDEKSVYPDVMCGTEPQNSKAWANWEEAYKSSYFEYVRSQYEKELSVRAVRDAIGRIDDFESLPAQWISSMKIHFATLPLAEFDFMIGSLREARFGRNSAWRQTSILAALDEFRHSQMPLLISHELVKWDPQFDWTQKLYFSNNWFSIAARHAMDDILLTSSTTEYAIGAHFIFENSFSNLQFMGLSSVAKKVGDKLFEKMIQSIQSDESRHTQIGQEVAEILSKQNPPYLQKLVDKWFWRNWLLFAFTTGFTMDYLTPVEKRTQSFKELCCELVIPQFLESIERLGLKKPWYWDTFMSTLDYYHHMLYATTYTYRSTVWFDMCMPNLKEREWLHRKYPKSWPTILPTWENIDKKWQENNSNEFDVHATSLMGFCNTCQMPLCCGTPSQNFSCNFEYGNKMFIFCSEPCRKIFQDEPEKYSQFVGLVEKIANDQAPANLVSLLEYFGLTRSTSGRDIFKGRYEWKQ